MTDIGPNMRKLITVFIAREAIPPSGGIEDAFKFFSDPEIRKQVLADATRNKNSLIETMRIMFPSYSDEELASYALSKIEEKKSEIRP